MSNILGYPLSVTLCRCSHITQYTHEYIHDDAEWPRVFTWSHISNPQGVKVVVLTDR